MVEKRNEGEIQENYQSVEVKLTKTKRQEENVVGGKKQMSGAERDSPACLLLF